MAPGGKSMRVVIVDGNSASLAQTKAIVDQLGCTCAAFSDPMQAIGDTTVTPADVIIASYNLPFLDGLGIIERLRSVSDYADIPIVLVTANEDAAVREEALQLGVTDLLRKPLDPIEVKGRLRSLFKLREAERRLQERLGQFEQAVQCANGLSSREEELMLRLSRAAEARDYESGDHILRMASYCRLIAEGMGLSERQCQTVFLAAPMHDIGKIAVSDSILLKPGKLTCEERAIMELHTLHGFKMLSGSDSEVIRSAADIAASHHERWDGTGYPARSRETGIPLFGRIAAVADVFDALTNERPYKEAWSPDDAMAYVTACAGQHFDPDCVHAFANRWPDAMAIFRMHNGGAGLGSVAAARAPVSPLGALHASA